MTDLDIVLLVLVAVVVLAMLPASRFLGRLSDRPSASEAEVEELEDRGTIW